MAKYSAIIRARHDTPSEEVAAAVGAVSRVVDARDFRGRGLKLYPVGLKADVVARIRHALVVLVGAGLVLLFMLMVNLASMLLARAAQREHEVAVSRALGANTIAIVRSTVMEGALLGITGGALGTLAAIWGTRALVAVAPLDLPRRLRADPGFRSEGVFTMRLRRPPEFFKEMADASFRVRVQDALAAIPGVTGVSAASALPLSATTPLTVIRIPGAPGNTGDAERDAVLTDIVGVAKNYVEVMGMRLVAGRTFTQSPPKA
jgi:hypothetical protein